MTAVMTNMPMQSAALCRHRGGVIYSYFNSGSSANYWQRNLVWGYHVF